MEAPFPIKMAREMANHSIYSDVVVRTINKSLERKAKDGLTRCTIIFPNMNNKVPFQQVEKAYKTAGYKFSYEKREEGYSVFVDWGE